MSSAEPDPVITGRRELYRRRVAWEWRAAASVAGVAAAGAILGLLPHPVADGWLLAGFAVIAVIALAVLVLAFVRPAPPLPPLPKHLRERDTAAAARRVQRGEPAEPAELQAAAIDQARRGLRIGHLTLSWMPMTGATWALRIGENSFYTGFGYVGLVLIVFGLACLGWSRVVQTRLDHLEATVDPSDAGSAADEPRDRDTATPKATGEK